MSDNHLVALAGQPNAGKSTIFNLLTGVRQHVANYPGVTVEKKTGFFRIDDDNVMLVDLPGTYSLTSYSLEERVARDFILQDRPSLVVNVADASNLPRHLFLTFQLLEMGVPVVVAMNMMDVAEARGLTIDADALSEKLGAPAVPMVGRKGVGKEELRQALSDRLSSQQDFAPPQIDYGDLEPEIEALERTLGEGVVPGVQTRWVAVKLLEGDEGVRDLILSAHPEARETLAGVEGVRREFGERTGMPTEQFIEKRRYEAAKAIAESCIVAPEEGAPTRSDRIDSVICHRIWGYPILFVVMYLMYYLSIEWGYKITEYTWPILAWGRETIAAFLPMEGFIEDPALRDLILWLVDSVNALLNYVPIFLILFAYIAFLEDLGYMPRMAFLLDAFFRRYGLHGQSTLPLVLGGVYVGGCAVPGVMACRAVPDERARLATILVVPMMNCLAKVPLYVLLIGIYFASHKGPAMFFIATITVLLALTTAKLLNLTVLREKESAPFILEMPPYHIPTAAGVLRRSAERVWMYVRKITTVVAAVAVILWVLMRFPGAPDQTMTALDAQAEQGRNQFIELAAKSGYGDSFQDAGDINAFFDFARRYKKSRAGVTNQSRAEEIDDGFQAENAAFFSVLKRRGGPEVRRLAREYNKLRRTRLTVRKEAKDATLQSSFLGRIGRWLEPATQYAGFNWRVNIALLSALAAKENTVATLGALYQPQEEADEEMAAESQTAAPETGAAALEQRMAEQEEGFTPLHALALMLFMALYPPCMAATMVVKIQSGAWKWMVFSLVYMICLGAVVALLVFSGGQALGLTGLEAMGWFYGLALAATVVTGLVEPQPTDEPQRPLVEVSK
ncbi:MAG: ferrous iron transport protein B [Desulfococcaceae bacterium]